jgi:hypothetical protein
VSEEFRRRFDNGDRGAVLRLLKMNPEFVSVRWVRDALEELEKHPVEPRRGPGRPHGEAAGTFALGLHLVLLVDKIHKETGKPKDEIFEELRGFGGLDAEGLSKRYYFTCRDPRVAAMLFVRE